ncbi:ABC transporter permease [Actinoplanes philippinensis]|uniref:Sulfonate transport system permease protein n=1 Tax=Actinoplanes philippinensis TaxID=35752 RepID=A0A1I2E8T0_9ACTN|nr:ABC transporter permease [Actinoplanes philippinensis]GIE77205.1 ABC transporter permease [Actinoplanes philippinensis]SFE88898.1 sulfonate transport system permease protein [Actinoplanes philippinensis]
MTTTAPPPVLGTPLPARQRRSRGPRRRYRLVSPLALLVLWEAAARTGLLPADKVPAPSLVAATGWRLAADGSLWEHLVSSLSRAGIGLAIGGTLAVALAAAAALLRLGDDIVDPPVQMARMLPHLGLVPLLIIWVGIGEELKISLVALGSFFPLYFNTYAGIRDIDQRLVEAAKTCGLDQWQRLRHVVLPGALPSLFLGLRLAIGAAWLSLVVGEQVNAQTGIGFLMMEAREFAQTDVVVFGLLVYAALGLLSDTLIRIAERRTLAWRRGLQAT